MITEATLGKALGGGLGPGLERSRAVDGPLETLLGSIAAHPDELLGPPSLARHLPPRQEVTTAPVERQPMRRSSTRVVPTSLPMRASPPAKQLSWTPEQCSEGPQCGQRPGMTSIFGSRFCCHPGCNDCLVENSALPFNTIKITCHCSSSSSSSSSSTATISPTRQAGVHEDDSGHNNTDAAVTESDDIALNVTAAAKSLLYVSLAVVVCACVLLGAVYACCMRRSAVTKTLKKKAEHDSVEALRHAFRQSELRSLLVQVDDEEETHVTAGAPRALVAGVDGGVQPSAQQCAEADREVERVLAATSARGVLGTGSPSERTAKFRRLVRLIHPDKGLVSGERANMALRRVVEARHELDDAA